MQYWGAETVITRDRAEIEKADRLLLPGVGSFGDAMAEISHNGLTDTLLSFVETGRPLLGICVGMQLLMERGTEYGTRAGLGLFVGEVTPIRIAATMANNSLATYWLARTDRDEFMGDDDLGWYR